MLPLLCPKVSQWASTPCIVTTREWLQLNFCSLRLQAVQDHESSASQSCTAKVPMQQAGNSQHDKGAYSSGRLPLYKTLPQPLSQAPAPAPLLSSHHKTNKFCSVAATLSLTLLAQPFTQLWLSAVWPTLGASPPGKCLGFRDTAAAHFNGRCSRQPQQFASSQTVRTN